MLVFQEIKRVYGDAGAVIDKGHLTDMLQA